MRHTPLLSIPLLFILASSGPTGALNTRQPHTSLLPRGTQGLHSK